jgi:hypothetical protein
MNPRLARLLVRLYPRAWRERYGTEFAALLETRHDGTRTSVFTLFRTAANVIWSALSERIFPTVGGNMEQSRFQSWCVRAPWAMFGLGPVLLLAAAYFVACFILWSGWKIFLPGADTPFVPIDGFAIVYFQAGRLIYFSAPILIGWAMAWVAGRQQLKALWPAVGWILIAFIGGTTQVYTSPPVGLSGAGHVRIGFPVGPSVQPFPDSVLHALVILLLTVLPYLVWRLTRARQLSA